MQSDNSHNNDTTHADDDDIDLIVSQLPKVRSRYRSGFSQYQGFWYQTFLVPNVIRFQRNFQVNEHDIILASKPKSGTTWLKALLFSVVNRGKYTVNDTPLLSSNPHKLVPSFELTLYTDPVNAPDLSHVACPRLFATHVPYTSLPESIRSSDQCRFVYACRNPLDMLVSYWHFISRQDDSRVDPTWTMEDYVDAFCRGEDTFGPFWDHVLGFWNASLERPDKVLFLKYEDMKEDTEGVVKRLAEFVDFPFSAEEEKEGVVQQICELCSLSSLKDIQAKNKPETAVSYLKNETFFRKGEIGNWVNELTPQMVDQLDKVIQEKLKGSGLVFKTSYK